MNSPFIQNPLSNPNLAESCGLGHLLPNAQPAQIPIPPCTPPDYPLVMPAPVPSPAIDAAAIQELTNAINNMTLSSQMQQQEIQKQHTENIMLRNNIQKMKNDKAYFRCFMDTVDGTAMCTESDGFRNKTTAIRVISIISAQSYRVPHKDGYIEAVIVRYTDSHRKLREITVTADEISAKNLVKKFYGFEYKCRSKSLASDYLACRINNVLSQYVITLHKYAGFYPDKKKAFFNCNWDDTNPEIAGFYPPCVASRKLKRYQKNIVEIQKNVKKYLCTTEKCLIFTFSVCGLLSTALKETGKAGGYALIDFLMMSLFQHQHFSPEKPLTLFADEIQNQNMRENSPIYQILRLGRKYRTGLNYATQFMPKVSKESNAVLETANLSVYFQPDNTSTASAAKNIGLPKKELICMNAGECYIKGDIFNYNSNHSIGTVLHGYTYCNFVPFSSD